MSTIRTTISQTLRTAGLSSYERQAEPVIAALEAREQAALDTIRAEGIEAGASESQVEAILIEAGLVERPAPVVEEPAEPQSLEAMVASLAESIKAQGERIETLVSAAARHGVRV